MTNWKWGWLKSACLIEDRHFFVLLHGDLHLPQARWEKGAGTRQRDDTCGRHGRLASRQTPGQKLPRRGISVAAGPRRSKVTEMMTRLALRASRGLRGRHVFLIEPQWSKESLILISGDRNPIFRGDSWKSGSPCVRDDCLPVKPLRLYRPSPYSVHRSQIYIDMTWTLPVQCLGSFPLASQGLDKDKGLCSLISTNDHKKNSWSCSIYIRIWLIHFKGTLKYGLFMTSQPFQCAASPKNVITIITSSTAHDCMCDMSPSMWPGGLPLSRCHGPSLKTE